MELSGLFGVVGSAAVEPEVDSVGIAVELFTFIIGLFICSFLVSCLTATNEAMQTVINTTIITVFFVTRFIIFLQPPEFYA